MFIETNNKFSRTQPTLTFGYHEHPDDTTHADRDECCLIKAIVEELHLTVEEEVVDGWYFGTVLAPSSEMLKLVKHLASLDLAKQTSLDIPNPEDAPIFAQVKNLGEAILIIDGQTYTCTGQSKGFRPRLSRAEPI
jgi:hypothetical protein